METKQDKRQKKTQNGLKEAAIMQVIALLDKLERGIEVLYYLMDNGKERSFVAALISAEGLDLERVIREQKRDTDLLFEVDKEKQLYALLCQGTEVDGGYYFVKRLVSTIQKEGGKNVYCSEIDVQNTQHPIQEIVFRLLNMYHRIKAEKADGKISFHSLAN